MDNSVPVVVIKDKGGHGALAIARSLGRLGVHTYLITKKKDAIASSRYWVKSFVWDFSAPRDQSLSFLLDVGRQIGTRAILLTIWDSGALFIENNTTALEKAFIFPKPAPGVIALLSNKWQMYLAAKKHGIPTPHVVFPQSRDEVTKFALTATFPIMMKGADQSMSQAKFKEVVHNSHDLIEQYDRADASGPANLILQEYIPGDESSVWMCNAYFDGDSRCRAVLAGKKLRQESAVGIATLAVCLPN